MVKALKSNRLLCVFTLIFMCIFITNPTIYMKSCLKGLKIWFYNVLPALFPFFIATKILIMLDIDAIAWLDKLTFKLFKAKNAGKIFCLSLLSGYPVGAKLICDAQKNGQIDNISAKKMLSFCSVSGPMFIVGTVGVAVFHSVKVGFVLLICHIISAIINGLVFRNMYGKPSEKKMIMSNKQKSNNILAESMIDSINAILLVGGYIVFAYILIDLFNNLNIIPLLASLLEKLPFLADKYDSIVAILNGLLEMTRGIIDTKSSGINLNIAIPIVSFLLGFGGVSIFLQSTSFASKLNIKKSTYFLQKLCQGFWSLIVGILICLIF